MTVQTVATNHPGALPVPVEGHAQGLTVLADWLAAADNASQLARQLVHSFFVPQAYKPNGPNGIEVAVANATGAILLGQSLGLDPLTSLQQIYVVHGRPGMYSKMKVALAQREGHRIWEEEYSPERSTWAGQRKGSEDVVRITLTIEDAKRAGWTSNAAYGKTPADMLAARCSARVVDRIAADALFGIRSIEDLDDEPAPAVTARVDTASILALPAPAAAPSAAQQDGPAAGGTGEGAPAAEVESDAITDAQLRMLGAVFGALDVSGSGSRERRLSIASRIVGRQLASSKDLTKNEASTVIDTLDSINKSTDRSERLAQVEGVAVDPDPVAEQAAAEATYADVMDEAVARADEQGDASEPDGWA